MIKIKYAKNELEITGHSGSAPKGEDLICAGVSSATVGLACALKSDNERGILEDLAIDMKDGFTYIKAVPKEGYEANIGIRFDTIFNVYDALAMEFPKHVSFKPRVGIRKQKTKALR